MRGWSEGRTGNSVPMGEAAGLAAAVSVKKNLMPHELKWREIKAFARS
ncbi:MAG: hypothetical protein P8M30_11350 [Planctomycetaceae bacterium]|jgi:hypothetical protein|nr:hypothetical protein [Planctomycetaceae bacterium]